MSGYFARLARRGAGIHDLPSVGAAITPESLPVPPPAVANPLATGPAAVVTQPIPGAPRAGPARPMDTPTPTAPAVRPGGRIEVPEPRPARVSLGAGPRPETAAAPAPLASRAARPADGATGLARGEASDAAAGRAEPDPVALEPRPVVAFAPTLPALIAPAPEGHARAPAPVVVRGAVEVVAGSEEPSPLHAPVPARDDGERAATPRTDPGHAPAAPPPDVTRPNPLGQAPPEAAVRPLFGPTAPRIPDVKIHIGRIEVRAPAPQPPRRPAPALRPLLPLSEYLRTRGQEARGGA